MHSDPPSPAGVRSAERSSPTLGAALSGRRVVVLGLGASGDAALRLALACGASCWGVDSATAERLGERWPGLRELEAAFVLGWSEGDALPAADLFVVSPGIAADAPLSRAARATGAPVVSELEFGAGLCSCPLLGVTGTNGKTTTVELVAHLLAAAGLRVRAAGNIGLPLAACATESAGLDALVVEVSSFQLEAVDRFRPAAAALLNVTPDHYDRHGGPGPYLAAKLALFRNMPDAGHIVLRADVARLPEARELLSGRGGAPILFSSAPQADCAFFADSGALCERGADGRVRRLLALDELPLAGMHNVENALAALALVRAFGQCPARAAAALPGFRPSPHRLELVAEIAGVRYVNDSKATNVDAMCRALETVAGSAPAPNVLLVAGGLDKDIDFSMALPVLEKCAKGAFLIGASKDRLAHEWHRVVSCHTFPALADAVSAAARLAVAGDTVLLSPGCASQDMFRNYAHRGDEFRALVQRRAGE